VAVFLFLFIPGVISFGYVFYKFFKKQISASDLTPFVLNILFNAIFTPIQFGLQNNILALVDILLVLGTLIWALTSIYKKYRWVSLINIPYLLWVTFATVLQISVTFLNF
jgi:tryptophan-rich sensory protein